VEALGGVVDGDDACAVGVREQQVVEVVEETDRGQGVGVRAGGVGQVEQFDSALVGEDHQL
jgi:hypothetical protein